MRPGAHHMVCAVRHTKPPLVCRSTKHVSEILLALESYLANKDLAISS